MTLTASMQDSWNQLEHWAGRQVASARGEAKLVTVRAECLQQAIRLSEGLAVYRILRDFHELDLNEVVNDIVAVLRQCLIVMLTTTGGGALIGGIAGGVFGAGVGAIPGIAIGAGAGAQMGEWILIFMGLKALSEYIVKDTPDIARRYWEGIRLAVSAATRPQLPQQPVHIDRFTLQIAADTLARAHVSMFVLLLMGILAYLAKGRGDMGQLAEGVRGGKMGPKFAEWMVRSEGKLNAEPRLQERGNPPRFGQDGGRLGKQQSDTVLPRRRNPARVEPEPVSLPPKAAEQQVVVPNSGAPNVENYVASLYRKATPTSTNAGLFEVEQTGPFNYRVTGGGTAIDVDGYQGTTLLDAKYVGNPANSPYVGGSNVPQFLRDKIALQQEYEFQRYQAVITDQSTPFSSLNVLTNEPAAVPYFQRLMNQYRIPGEVQVVPTNIPQTVSPRP